MVVATVGTLALVGYGLVDHVLDGGSGHVRYLLPAWWVPAVGIGAILWVAGRRASVVLVGGAWLALVAGTVWVLDAAVAQSGLRGASGSSTWERLTSLLGTFGALGTVIVFGLSATLALSLLALPWAIARVPAVLPVADAPAV
jgi:hypothetical protein